MTSLPAQRKRIQSIDILRGMVMVIMALDHVRDFFYRASIHGAANIATNPTDIDTTTPALFFTRWITHFCAPVFVFLSGTSVWLMTRNKTKKEISVFLIKRGAWLIFAELFIVTLSWSFDPLYHVFFLQVIWAIGISMVILGILVYLPSQLILFIGLIILVGHNILDYPAVNKNLQSGFLGDLLYFARFSAYPVLNRVALIVYAFVPWTAVMMVGYCFGQIYGEGVGIIRRRKFLITTGIMIILLFVGLRFSNLYGDPVAWVRHARGPVYTFLSFLNTNKYPPSLLFLCMTLGPSFIALALLERSKGRFAAVMNIYGRVPMFYYILHLYLIHTLTVIVFFLSGYTSKDIISPGSPFLFRPPDFGFPLLGVYLVWILVVIILYPLCKKYNRYKSTHRQWWLKYI